MQVYWCWFVELRIGSTEENITFGLYTPSSWIPKQVMPTTFLFFNCYSYSSRFSSSSSIEVRLYHHRVLRFHYHSVGWRRSFRHQVSYLVRICCSMFQCWNHLQVTTINMGFLIITSIKLIIPTHLGLSQASFSPLSAFTIYSAPHVLGSITTL